MNMQEIREIARSHGLKTGKQTKITLIRNIQRAEGNFDCFATASDGDCSQQDCLWRQDCLALSVKQAS
ncbi:MAG: SAP domain-containing protein [Gammaproteobacteria bacterium]